jgi:hypothetical protein
MQIDCDRERQTSVPSFSGNQKNSYPGKEKGPGLNIPWVVFVHPSIPSSEYHGGRGPFPLYPLASVSFLLF